MNFTQDTIDICLPRYTLWVDTGRKSKSTIYSILTISITLVRHYMNGPIVEDEESINEGSYSQPTSSTGSIASHTTRRRSTRTSTTSTSPLSTHTIPENDTVDFVIAEDEDNQQSNVDFLTENDMLESQDEDVENDEDGEDDF